MSNFLKLNGQWRSQELQNGRTARPFESGKAGGRGRRGTFLGCSGCFQFVQQVLQLLKRHTLLVSLDICVSRSVTVPTGEQNAHGRRHSETRLLGPRPDQYPPRLRTRCCRDVRKIIQISTAPSGLFALCDDGTVWGFTANHPGWMRVPDIPQDPPPEERENPVWRWE